MSPFLIVLVCVYPLFAGSGLIAFMRAARLTSEDWDLHSAVRRMELALLLAEEQAAHEAKIRLSSSAGQA